MSEPSSPSWMQRVANWVFGYDYFISYAHADGSVYARALATALRQRGRQCFLDVDHYRIGDDWMGVGHWTLKRTTCLIVVGSPAALTSEPVAHEVGLFRSMSNQVVPIDFDGSLMHRASDSGLHALLPETILRLLERDRLQIGPSDDAIARIIGDFKGLTQNRKRVRALTVAVCAFAALAVCAAYFGVVSQRNAVLAERSRVLAEQNADEARQNADEAKREQERAEEAARKAAVEASRNSFALSVSASETENDPWSALVLALRAAETLPNNEPMFDLYLSRALHLVDRLADTVLNLPLSEGVQMATFSPRLDRVAIVTDNDQVQVFALPDGKPLRVPAFVNKRGCSAKTPEFFDMAVRFESTSTGSTPSPTLRNRAPTCSRRSGTC